MNARPERSWRIGIVGGGAAGLATAAALRDAGYHDVVVFERADRVGGKCWTRTLDGRTYELGAGALTTAYTNVRSLMRAHGISASPGLSGLYVDPDDGRSSFVAPPLRAHAFWKLGVEGVRLAALLARASSLRRAGLDGIDPEFHAPFAEWARAHRVERVAAFLEPWFTGFGYGYFDEVPAAYVLKYASLFRVPIFELLDGGYQALWERVARDLDVRLGVAVRSVRRSSGHEAVRVETETGAFTFDALVLTAPFDQALAMLDVDTEERALYEQVRCNDYHVVGVRMDRPPNARYGFFAANFRRERAGQPIFFYRRWLDRDIVFFYTMPGDPTPIDVSVRAVADTITRTGGTVRDVVVQHRWRYFPHVTSGAMRSGFFDRLQAMQGRRRTWIAGETCAFAAVECVVAHARAMIERYFVGAERP